ncbi:MAG: hypothetical protein ABI406_12910, partial [Ktedonobacteraceae bacterium]
MPQSQVNKLAGWHIATLVPWVRYIGPLRACGRRSAPRATACRGLMYRAHRDERSNVESLFPDSLFN